MNINDAYTGQKVSLIKIDSSNPYYIIDMLGWFNKTGIIQDIILYDLFPAVRVKFTKEGKYSQYIIVPLDWIKSEEDIYEAKLVCIDPGNYGRFFESGHIYHYKNNKLSTKDKKTFFDIKNVKALKDIEEYFEKICCSYFCEHCDIPYEREVPPQFIELVEK